MIKEKSTLLLKIALFGTAVLWIFFASLFTLTTYIDSIYFALDKVSGHFFSLPIQLTLLIFVLLLLLYAFILIYLQSFHNSEKRWFLLGTSVLVATIAAVFTYPVGALDLFNYVLMGKLVVFYKQNPFLVPFNAVTGTDPLQQYAIFLDVTTGYGPWWLLLTSFVVLVSGTSSIFWMVLSYKVMTALFFILTGVVLYHIPQEKHEKLLACITYLLNPYVIFDGVVNAHNDILVCFFIILAWWCYKKKHMAVFLCLILAALIKLYAVVLIPLFLLYVIKDKWPTKEIIVSIILSVLCFVIIYLPFFAKGEIIVGIVQGAINAQAINGYSPYSLAREYLTAIQASASSYTFIQRIFWGLFVSVFLSLLFFVSKKEKYLTILVIVLLAFLLSATILQPWYLIPILGMMALSPKKRHQIFLVVISAGALLSYPVSVWAWFHSGWSVIAVHLLLACFITVPSLLYLLYLLKTVILARSIVQD